MKTYDFQGKSRDAGFAGVYTLRNGSGTISGSYTYVVDSGNQVKQNTFRPAKGSLWRKQQFKKDATAPLSLQQGK